MGNYISKRNLPATTTNTGQKIDMQLLRTSFGLERYRHF